MSPASVLVCLVVGNALFYTAGSAVWALSSLILRRLAPDEKVDGVDRAFACFLAALWLVAAGMVVLFGFALGAKVRGAL